MMCMMRRMFFIFIGTLILLAAGCNPTNLPSSPPSQVWILEPEDGATLPISPFLIRVQGASFTGIEQFEVYFSVSITPFTFLYIDPLTTGPGGSEYGTMFYSETTWSPPGAGNFTITVRARNADNQYSPDAEVHVTVGEYVAALPALLTLEVIEVGSSPTPTEFINYRAFAVKNANCRAGPGTAHNETGFVPQGSTVEVVGRNEDGTWFKVANPNGAGFCWVSMIAFEIKFDVELIPVDAAIPTAPARVSEEQKEEAEQMGCMVTDRLNNQTRCESPCPAGAVPGTACTP